MASMATREMKVSQPTYRWNIVISTILTGIALVGHVLTIQIGERLPGYFQDVILTALALGIGFAIIYVVGFGLSTLTIRDVLTRHQHEVVYRFAQLTTVIIALLIVTISIWEFAVGNVLIGAGVISVLLAIAAQKTLGSVLSGIIIMTTDFFRVGDWVKIDERFGKIQQISLFNTQILSPQGETHIFPNDQITTRDITNLAHNRYRNDVLVGIDYDSDIPRVIEVCDAALQDLTEAEQNHVDGFNPTSVKSFDDSQITLAVKMWIQRPNPMLINQAQTTVLSELHQRFQDENIDIPFPQRMVSERVSSDGDT
jgi:small-conductance mechanosensitive channel